MHFQIYIPGARGQDSRLLVDVGLADLVAGAEFMEVPEGPAEEGAGPPGVIVAWRRPGQACMGFNPEEQAWSPAVRCGDLAPQRYWIGFWKEALPTPGDLARPYAQVGIRLPLGDGNEWLIPTANRLDAEMIAADDGTWRFEVQRRFHSFYLEHNKWLSFFGTDKWREGFDFGEAADFVLSGLRINYRIVPECTNRLRLFTTHNITTSLLAIMGISPETVGMSVAAPEPAVRSSLPRVGSI